MAGPSVTYTLVNGNVSDAGQINQNYTDLVNGMTDGTKDLNISAITAAGVATFNGNTILGNAISDTVTVNGVFAGTGGDGTATQKGLITTGAQTIAGAKTFSSTIVGSINGNAATVTNGVYTTGDQTIAGTKTFSSTIAGNITGNATTVTNGVYTTGNQTVAGVKTFSDTLTAAGVISQTNGILKTNYTTESMGQIETSTQFSLAQTGTKSITIAVNAGLVFITDANNGESALIFIGATSLIISQSVSGKWSLSAGTDHRFEFNNTNKVATITRNAAGTNTYQLISLGCQG